MTVRIPRVLFGMLIVMAVAAVTLATRQEVSSTAAPAWSEFGAGWARAGQQYESPSVSLDGSKGNPNAIRFKAWSGRTGQRAYVSWDLTCWRGSNYGSRSGTIDNRSLPFTKQFTLPVANPDYCSLDVIAFLDGLGIIQVRLQSR
ncbi:MAG: hypothetical protein WBD55_06695 [Dehalococcoidia bacterium]